MHKEQLSWGGQPRFNCARRFCPACLAGLGYDNVETKHSCIPPSSPLRMLALTPTPPWHSEEGAEMLAFTRSNSRKNGATVPIPHQKQGMAHNHLRRQGLHYQRQTQHVQASGSAALGSSGEIGHSGLSRECFPFSWIFFTSQGTTERYLSYHAQAVSKVCTVYGGQRESSDKFYCL